MSVPDDSDTSFPNLLDRAMAHVVGSEEIKAAAANLTEPLDLAVALRETMRDPASRGLRLGEWARTFELSSFRLEKHRRELRLFSNLAPFRVITFLFPFPALLVIAVLVVPGVLLGLGEKSLSLAAFSLLSVVAVLSTARRFSKDGATRMAEESSALRTLKSEIGKAEQAHLQRIALLLEEMRVAFLPHARTLINARRQDLTSNVMPAVKAPGLSRVLPGSMRTIGPEMEELLSIARSNHTASIGISGPRGCGKSTLIDKLCSQEESSIFAYTLKVDAPVGFDSRDFLLHLFAKVCESICGKEELPESKTVERSKIRRSFLSGTVIAMSVVTLAFIALAVLVLFLYVLPGVAVALGVVESLASLMQRASVILRGEATDGSSVALLMTAVAAGFLLVAALVFFARRRMFRNRFIFWAGRRRPEGPFLVGASVPATVAFLMARYPLATDVFPSPRTLLLASGVLALLSAAGAIAYAAVLVRDRVPSRSTVEFGGRASLATITIVADARRHLRRIRFQQSHTTGWGGKISGSVKVGSAEVSQTDGKAWAEQSWTMPEIIESFRELLRQRCAERKMLIAIDEMDKISRVDDAGVFLDDIKAIFSVPNVYYLISVSDDAVASFERRGLPVRDAFDSALDEIVRIELAPYAHSERILMSRVVGMPEIFKALCHVLSGGLPRDLIRCARHTYEVKRPARVDIMARSLTRRELLDKLPALVSSLPQTRVGSSVARLWRIASRCRREFEDVAALHDQLEYLMKEVEMLEVSEWTDADEGTFVDVVRQMTAVVALAVTIVEFCDRLTSRSVVREVTVRFAQLAYCRQEMVVHPILAFESLNQFREDEGLPALR